MRNRNQGDQAPPGGGLPKGLPFVLSDGSDFYGEDSCRSSHFGFGRSGSTVLSYVRPMDFASNPPKPPDQGLAKP